MKNLLLNLSILGAFFLVSCATDIKEIKDNPTNFENKDVTVKGTVKSVTDLLVKKGFFIEDNTGEIFILTDNALPETGEQKTVTGQVKNSPALLGNSIVVIKENKK